MIKTVLLLLLMALLPVQPYADISNLLGEGLYEPLASPPSKKPFYLPLRELPVPEPEQPFVEPLKEFVTPVVAIIIDDIGYNQRLSLAALALPGDITFALIPFSPNALAFAKAAQAQQKEVMLHAPMSDIRRRPVPQGGLAIGMSREVLLETLNQSLDSLPNIRGVNNHQGSLLTQKVEPMQWIMETLKARDLYFVDSRTTHKSVAYQTATRFRVPALRRDIFLDHERNLDFIEQQFTQLMMIAKRRGYAVAIGHPYPETIQFLSDNINRLESNGIKLLPVSKLLQTPDSLAKK